MILNGDIEMSSCDNPMKTEGERETKKIKSGKKNNTKERYKRHQTEDGKEYFERVSDGTTHWSLPDNSVVI